MSNSFKIETKDDFYLLSDMDFDSDSNALLQEAEGILATGKMDFVLSLESVRVLYSSHLAVFVRLQQLLQRNEKRLVITNASQEVKNLLQITQLESILSVYNTVEEYMAGRPIKSVNVEKPPFEWEIHELDNESVLIKCKGAMIANELLASLQSRIDKYFYISFNFAELTEIDNASITFLDRFSDTHQISVSSAASEILGQLKQCRLCDKIKII